MTTCYHSTSAAAAEFVLGQGFQDKTDDHPLFGEVTGVYLCEEPLVEGVGFPVGTPAANYAHVLEVRFEHGFDLVRFILDSSSPRIWLLPASEINSHAAVIEFSD